MHHTKDVFKALSTMFRPNDSIFGLEFYLFKHMTGQGNLSFRSVKKPKRTNRYIFVKKLRKPSGTVIYSYFKDGTFMMKRVGLSHRLRKGCLICQKRYIQTRVYRGYYTEARRYEFYFRVAKQYFTHSLRSFVKYCFATRK